MTQDFVLGLRLLQKLCFASNHVIRLQCDPEQVDNLFLKQNSCNYFVYPSLFFNFYEVPVCFNRCYAMLVTSYSKKGILSTCMLLTRLEDTTCGRASFSISFYVLHPMYIHSCFTNAIYLFFSAKSIFDSENENSEEQY